MYVFVVTYLYKNKTCAKNSKIMALFSWGSNSCGQLGLGYKSEQETIPKEGQRLKIPVLQISGGGNHTVLLGVNDALWCSGKNDRNQLSCCLLDTVDFQLLHHPFLKKIVKVSCGWDFTLSLLEDGEVYGWGANLFGQLGFSVLQVKSLHEPTKILINKCVDIGTGLRHSGLVTSLGTVFCSGSNSKGQLGLGSENYSSKVDSFSVVPFIKDIVKIGCGEHFTLALSSTNAVFVWGDNKFGQLGEEKDILNRSSSPRLVNLPTTRLIKSIHCGWTHCSLLTDDGRVISWGRQDYGQLGEKRLRPWEAKILSIPVKLKQLAVGSEHTIGLTESNVILSWGWNEHGNCGSGDTEPVWSPMPVQVPTNFKALLIGSGYAHSFSFGSFSMDEFGT